MGRAATLCCCYSQKKKSRMLARTSFIQITVLLTKHSFPLNKKALFRDEIFRMIFDPLFGYNPRQSGREGFHLVHREEEKGIQKSQAGVGRRTHV